MIDQFTKKPIKIIPENKGGPMLRIALDQLQEVQGLLDKHQVRYWVPEYAGSFNDGPWMISVFFTRRTDLKKVKQILDAVS